MNRKFWLSLALGGVLLGSVTQAQARLYKWVDEKGAVHYGDKIPPRYSKQQHQELNARGVRTKAVARQKTAQERQAEQAAKSEEQQRLDKERRLAAEQSRKDQILLDTFTVERDLIIMRDDRLSAIDSTTNLTQSYNKQLDKQLSSAQEHIDSLESAQREVPENLAKKVKNLTGQLQKNTAHIARLQKDRVLLEKQFEQDLVRFRELKGIAPPLQEATSEPEAN